MGDIENSKKKLAIVVGSGLLPEEVIKSVKKMHIEYVIVKFEGIKSASFIGNPIIEATFETIADLFSQLEFEGYNSIVCCGYMAPPILDLKKIGDNSREILEPILKNLQLGDEAIFSSILKLFSDKKLEPISLTEILPKCFPEIEFLTLRKPDHIDQLDSIRAENILRSISPADLGQSLVVRNNACIAVETSLGTDKMLELLALGISSDYYTGIGGLVYKGPKHKQNPFLDLPVIGEKTIDGIKRAGLNGLVIKHANVIVLRPEETIKLANQLGIFIWSKK